MSSLFTFAVKHVTGILIAAPIILILFGLSYASVSPAGFSCTGLLNGLALGGSFLMTLESPRSVALPPWIAALAWIVCFTGWLLIPLLASALISESLKVVDKEKWYIAKFTVLGLRSGIAQDKMKEWVREAIRLKDSVLEE